MVAPDATFRRPEARFEAPPRARMTLTETTVELEAAGTAQARKTYTRHGAHEPMFGTSSATLKVLMKRIDVDHELALALWETGNFDARNLAVKIVDSSRTNPRSSAASTPHPTGCAAE